MERTHTIRLTEPLEAMGIQLTDFTADVTAILVPASEGAPAHVELTEVAQISGPHIPPAKLAAWAEFWVAANQHRIRSGRAGGPSDVTTPRRG